MRSLIDPQYRWLIWAIVIVLVVGFSLLTYVYIAGFELESGPIVSSVIPPKGTIKISSTPSGAKIFLDDKDTGQTTEAEIKTKAGSHTIKLTKEGYEDVTVQVTIEKNQTTEVKTTLEKTKKVTSPTPKEKFIKVISPNGGEEWIEGNTYTITWSSQGVEKVDIEVASGGKDLGHIAFGADAKAGKYSWEIPPGFISGFGPSSSEDMKIRISATNNPSLYDENDNYFTIMAK